MAKFVLTAQLQLQAPRNVQAIVRQIQSQLDGVKVKVGVEGASRAQADLKKVDQSVKQVTDSADRMGKAFAVSIKRFAAFSIATRAVGLFTRGLGGAVTEAIDFERQLIKVAQVTGKTMGELKGLTKEITKLSTNLGVSSAKLIEVSRTLSQAGLSAQETKIALEALAKSELAPTFTDIAQTAEGVVAIFNQFGKGAEAIEKQLGAINAVAGQFAVEAGDLIAVIRRTGGVFKAAGGDLNELIALFTSVRATTRESAESIATGLRTIFTRIQRPSTIKFLKELGVELVNAEGKFVGPYEAIRRLSDAMSGLEPGDLRFVQIAEQLGGFRQIGKVLPLLQQFAVAQEALNVAMQGGDTLAKDAATAQETLAVKITKVKEEFLALIRTVTESKTFQVMANTALSLASALIKIADALTPLIPMLTALAAIKIFSGIQGFAGGVMGGMGKGGAGGATKFASGGMVPGSGNRDTVPAMLTPGEFVIKKSSVKSIGSDRLAGMNKYAKGGPVIDLQDGTVGGFFLVPSKGEDRDSRQKYSNIGKITNRQVLADLLARQTSGSKPGSKKYQASSKTSLQDQKKSMTRDLTDSDASIRWDSLSARNQRSAIEKDGVSGTWDQTLLKNPGSKLSSKGLNLKTVGKGTKGLSLLKGTMPAGFQSSKSVAIGGRMKGMLLGQGDTEITAAVADVASEIASKKLEEAIDDITKSKAISSVLNGIGNTIKPNKKSYDKTIKELISKDNTAVQSIEGYVQEGLVSALTGAKVGGGESSFDFPSLATHKKSLELLYGPIGNLKSADAKRNMKGSWKKIATKTLNTINSGDGSELLQNAVVSGFANETPMRFAKGGSVTDTVPSLLTPGEFVVNKQSAQGIGYGNLNRMNSRGVAGFASGGIVGGPRTFAEGGKNGGGGGGGIMGGGGMMAIMAFSAALPMATDALADLTGATDAQKDELDSIVKHTMKAGMMFAFISDRIGKHAEAVEEAGKKAIESGDEWVKKAQAAGMSIKEIGAMAREAGPYGPKGKEALEGIGSGVESAKTTSQASEQMRSIQARIVVEEEKIGEARADSAQASDDVGAAERYGTRLDEKSADAAYEEAGAEEKVARVQQEGVTVQERHDVAQADSAEAEERFRTEGAKLDNEEVSASGQLDTVRRDRTVTDHKANRAEQDFTETTNREVTAARERNVVSTEDKVGTEQAELDRMIQSRQTVREREVPGADAVRQADRPDIATDPRIQKENANRLARAQEKLDKAKSQAQAGGGTIVGGGAGAGAVAVQQMQVQAQQVNIQAQNVTTSEGGGADSGTGPVFKTKEMAEAEAEVAAAKDPTMAMGSVGTRFAPTESRFMTTASDADIVAQRDVVSEAQTAAGMARNKTSFPLPPADAVARAQRAVVPVPAGSDSDLDRKGSDAVLAAEEKAVALRTKANALAEKQAALEARLLAIGEERTSLAEDMADKNLTAAEHAGYLAESNAQELAAQEELNAAKEYHNELMDETAANAEFLVEATDRQVEAEKRVAKAQKERDRLGNVAEYGADDPSGMGPIHAQQNLENTITASKITTAVGGKETEAGEKVAIGLEHLDKSTTDYTQKLNKQKEFLEAYSKELARGVDPAKAYTRAMEQAGAGVSKFSQRFPKAGAALGKFTSAVRGVAGKLKSSFNKLNDKMAGMGKAIGGVMALGQAAVAMVSDMQKMNFEKQIEGGEFDEAEAGIGGMMKTEALGGVMSGAMSGAAMGAMFGPLGMAIGALVGAIGSLIMTILNWKNKQREMETKVVKARLESASKDQTAMMDKAAEKGMNASDINDFNVSMKKSEQALNQRSNADGKLLITGDARVRSEKEIAAKQMQGARIIGANVKTRKELNEAMAQMAGDSIGNSEAEMDAARSAFALAEMNRKLAKANMDLIKVASVFGAANSAVNDFIAGLETGGNALARLAAKTEEAMKNMAMGQGGGQVIAEARKATMEQLQKADIGKNSELGKSVNRGFDSMSDTATFMANAPQQAAGLTFKKDAAPEVVRESLKGSLMTADKVGTMQGDIIEGHLAKLTDKQLRDIASGDLDISSVIDGMSEDMQKAAAPALAAMKALAAHTNTMIKLTKQRMQAEQNLQNAQKNAVDVFMDAADIIAKVGGPAVTEETKRAATLEKANISGRGLGLADLKTGDAGEMRARTTEIMNKFAKLETEGRKSGRFSGASGLEEDQRKGLQKALKDQIAVQKKLIQAKFQELKILDKKNALEKESLEALLKGDIEGFMKGQSAAGAQAAAAAGDVDMLKMFGAEAAGEALKNVQKAEAAGAREIGGTSIEEIKRTLAESGLAQRGVVDPQAAAMLAGQTPEQERIKGEITEQAKAMSDSGQTLADMAEMEVQTANMTIQTANITFKEKLKESSKQIERRWGGVVHANRGMFVPRGTDTVPAMLTPGEFVVRKESVNKGENLSMLQSLNRGSLVSTDGSGGLQRLAQGGKVNYYQGGTPNTVPAGGGFGLDPVLLGQLTSSLDRFNTNLASNIKSLENMKFQIKLDTTNVNVNLNGTSFLAQLKDGLKSELMDEIGERIKELKFNDAGEPKTNSSVL